MAQAYKNRMVSETTWLSKIKATELEKSYNDEVRLIRKEAEKSLARMQLQAQAVEQRHENKLLRLKNEKEHLLAIERERVEKVSLQLGPLNTKLDFMRSKAVELQRKYNRELVSNRSLTKEKQKLERNKAQVENYQRDIDAMRVKRDKALKLVKEMATKQKRDIDAMREEREEMRMERDNALKLVEEMITKQKRDIDAVREEREAMREEREAMRVERDNALKLVEEMTAKRMEELVPPRSFTCPISQEMMQDPQITADGHTYEAEAIRTWFARGKDTSPMTNLRLPHRNLVPNRALRSAIQDFRLS